MNEGIYRVLRSLGDGKERSVDDAVVASGQAVSVVREFLNRHPKWVDNDDRLFRCSQAGFAALAREMVARQPQLETDELRESFAKLCERRMAAKRELDQFYATTDTVVRRARLLVEQGEQQRGILFLGDDDLTNVAVGLTGTDRQMSVLDVDEDVIRLSQEMADEMGRPLQTLRHDLREPLPRKWTKKFGCVFTDPPYAPEGFALFISRAIEALKADGRLYVSFGSSRRASERGLSKQKILTDAGLYVERVIEDFNRYDGAESIGSTSALWITRMTPKSKSLVQGEFEGELYSARPPSGSASTSDKLTE